jgi:phosphonate transport system substrate-binding protein
MTDLTVISLLSHKSRPAHTAIAAFLREHAGIDAHLVSGPPWQVQLRMLDAGVAHMAFICGLPYTRRADAFEPVAAPVQAGPRYRGRPVYFSDVVVRRESRFRRFGDLRGARLAYNELGSLSGYEALRAHLAQLGHLAGFFGAAIETGDHMVSLGLLVEGECDAAAIDSTVLELALRDNPDLSMQIRSVAALGPHPAPPCVVSRALPAATKESLRAALVALHEHPAGRAALEAGRLLGFAPVSDADYEPIRRVARLAAGVALT